MFALFDGHAGREVAIFAAKHLPDVIVQVPFKMLILFRISSFVLNYSMHFDLFMSQCTSGVDDACRALVPVLLCVIRATLFVPRSPQMWSHCRQRHLLGAT